MDYIDNLKARSRVIYDIVIKIFILILLSLLLAQSTPGTNSFAVSSTFPEGNLIVDVIL